MFNKIKYAHPAIIAVFISISGLLLMSVLVVMFGWLRSSEFAKATGIADSANRVYALQQALYWSGRAILHHDAKYPVTPTRMYGSIAGLAPNGMIVVKVYEDAEIKTRTAWLADVKVANANQFVEQVLAVRDNQAEFEFYNPEEVVVWMDRAPWNIHLIACGAMHPDERPPTNIVDKAFAEFYWRIAKGENQ